jgi:hypothetical protein
MGCCSPWLCAFAGTCIQKHSGCNQFVMWIQSGLYVSPHCFFGICVSTNEHIHKLDRIVYYLVVVTLLVDNELRRPEITDGCSSRMDPLHDRMYQCFCCSVLHGTMRNVLPLPVSKPPNTHCPFIWCHRLYFHFPNLVLSIYTIFLTLNYFFLYVFMRDQTSPPYKS